MTEQKIKEYLSNGGNVMHVMNIDTVRDGGTKVINTSIGNIWVHKDTKKLYTQYSMEEEDLITGSLQLDYIFHNIQLYINKKKNIVQRDENLLNDIISNNF